MAGRAPPRFRCQEGRAVPWDTLCAARWAVGAMLWPLGGGPSRREKRGKPRQVAWGHGGIPGHRQTPWLRTEGWAAQSGAGEAQGRNADTGVGAAKEKTRTGEREEKQRKKEGERQEAGDREAGSPRSPVGALEKAAPGPTGQAPPGRDVDVMTQGGCTLLFL